MLHLRQWCVHKAAALDHGLHTAVHAPMIIRVACADKGAEVPDRGLRCVLLAVRVGCNDAELA